MADWRTAFAAAAVLSAACSAPAPPPETPPIEPDPWECWPVAGLVGLPLAAGTAGEPVDVRVELPLRCVESGARANAGVLGPSGDSLEVTVVEVNDLHLARPGEGRHVSALVRFTPTKPGWHHVAVRFQPALGLAETDVLVAADRRQDQPVVQVGTATELASCTHVELTEDGQLLCLAPRLAVFAPDGGVVQTLAPSGIGARWGRTLWFEDQDADAGYLRRCVESAGAFTCSAGEASRARDDWMILPSDDDAVVLGPRGPTAHRVSTGAGALTWSSFTLQSDELPISSAARDGAVIWWVAGPWVCDLSLASEARSPCTSFGSSYLIGLGAGSGGLWTANVLFADKRVIELQRPGPAGALVLHVPGAASFRPPARMTWNSGAWFTVGDARYAARQRGSETTLERMPNGGTVSSVTSSAFTIVDGSTVRVYAR